MSEKKRKVLMYNALVRALGISDLISFTCNYSQTNECLMNCSSRLVLLVESLCFSADGPSQILQTSCETNKINKSINKSGT